MDIPPIDFSIDFPGIGIDGEIMQIQFKDLHNRYDQRARQLLNLNYEGGEQRMLEEIITVFTRLSPGTVTLGQQKSHYKITKKGLYGKDAGLVEQPLDYINFQENLGYGDGDGLLQNMYISPSRRKNISSFSIASSATMKPYAHDVPEGSRVYYLAFGWAGDKQEMIPRPEIFSQLADEVIDSGLGADIGLNMSMESMRVRRSFTGERHRPSAWVHVE